MKIRKATLKYAKILDSHNQEFFHEEGRDWKKLVSSKDSVMFVYEEGRDWKKLVSSKDSVMFVLEVDNKIIGFTGMEFSDWNNTIKIVMSYSLSDFSR